jgi:dinuclear metal center YbgI/SA1388 family protein
MKPATVADIVARLEALAPPHLAEEWDNVGLQVGRGEQPVARLRVALDPSPEVIAQACADGIAMLVTHHPLILRPLRRLDGGDGPGRSLQAAVRHDLAVYCAHTNLDAAPGGVNDVLAERLGLVALQPLAPSPAAAAPGRLKLVFFAPLESREALLGVLADSPAGRIGAYSGCSFRVQGTGTFRAGRGARPAIGQVGAFTEVEEWRIETVVARRDLEEVLARLRRAHPYEEMAFDLYPLDPLPAPAAGIGRLGRLPRPLTLQRFARRVKAALGLRRLRMVGSPAMAVRRVALCSGSGSSLMGAFLGCGADCYVAGDLRYHDARDAEAAGRGLLDVGHFASERPVVPSLAERLRQALAADGFQVAVDACASERDPFVTL